MVLLFNYEKRCSHLWRTWIFFKQQTTAQKIRKKKCIIRHIIRVNGFLADCVSLLYLMWIVYLLVRGTMRLIFFVSRSKEIKHSSTVIFVMLPKKKVKNLFIQRCLKTLHWDLPQNPWHDKTKQSLTNVQYSYILKYKAIDKIIHNFQLFYSKSWHGLINIACELYEFS